MKSKFGLRVQKIFVIDMRSIPIFRGLIRGKHGRHGAASFGEDTFHAWIRRRSIGELQTLMSVDVCGIRVVFSESQFARPLGI